MTDVSTLPSVELGVLDLSRSGGGAGHNPGCQTARQGHYHNPPTVFRVEWLLSTTSFAEFLLWITPNCVGGRRYNSNMRSKLASGRDAVMAVLDRYRMIVSELVDLPLDALAVPDLFAVLDTMETGRCQVSGIEHQAINRIAAQATPEQIGTSLKKVLAERLRIRPGEAKRRIGDAERLGARTSMTGEPLTPLWAATAAGQRAGEINTDHVREIGRFFAQLPCWIDEATRERAERQLAANARQHRPDELRILADKLADCLNPDGNFTDEDRCHRRGISIGRQGIDGMSPITGWLNPEVRAGLDAVLSKTRCSVSGRPRPCAIRPMSHPPWTAPPRPRRSKPIPAPQPNAITMRSTRCAAACWRPASWVAITACR